MSAFLRRILVAVEPDRLALDANARKELCADLRALAELDADAQLRPEVERECTLTVHGRCGKGRGRGRVREAVLRKADLGVRRRIQIHAHRARDLPVHGKRKIHIAAEQCGRHVRQDRERDLHTELRFVVTVAVDLLDAVSLGFRFKGQERINIRIEHESALQRDPTEQLLAVIIPHLNHNDTRNVRLQRDALPDFAGDLLHGNVETSLRTRPRAFLRHDRKPHRDIHTGEFIECGQILRGILYLHRNLREASRRSGRARSDLRNAEDRPFAVRRCDIDLVSDPNLRRGRGNAVQERLAVRIGLLYDRRRRQYPNVIGKHEKIAVSVIDDRIAFREVVLRGVQEILVPRRISDVVRLCKRFSACIEKHRFCHEAGRERPRNVQRYRALACHGDVALRKHRTVFDIYLVLRELLRIIGFFINEAHEKRAGCKHVDAYRHRLLVIGNRNRRNAVGRRGRCVLAIAGNEGEIPRHGSAEVIRRRVRL